MKNYLKQWKTKFFIIFIIIFLCSGCMTTPPIGYYDSLFKKEKVVFSRNKEISFLFKPKEYGLYTIYLADLNKEKNSYYLSEDVRYTLSCKSQSGLDMKMSSLNYEREFFKADKLLRLDGRTEQERNSARKYFFTMDLYSLMGVSFTDGGGAGPRKTVFDDMEHELTCVMRLIMGPDDYFEGSLVIKRTSHK